MIFGQKQSQKAGENSVQNQVAGPVVQHFHQGITEERALVIAREAADTVLQQYSEEARVTGAARVAQFDGILVERLSRIGTLNSLCDPAQLLQIKRAQLGAATSDQTSDYHVLANLIGEHSKDTTERVRRAAVAKAIEIVAQVDHSALRALTVYVVATSFRATCATLRETLSILDGLYAAALVSQDPLPAGEDWVEHLHVLGAVSIESVMHFTPLSQLLMQRGWGSTLAGFTCEGVAESDQAEARRRAGEEFEAVGIPARLVPGLVLHELRSDEGLLRPFVPDPTIIVQTVEKEVGKLTHEQMAMVIRICDSTLGLMPVIDAAPIAETLRVRLMTERSSFAHLAMFDQWWPTLGPYFKVTSVGRALAMANMERLSPGLFPTY